MAKKEKEEENDPVEELFEFLATWGAQNGFQFIVPSDSEKNIDFININFKTNKIYVDELNVTDPLTEVG